MTLVLPRIIPRIEWGARYGSGSDATAYLPWGEAVIHTEAGAIRPGDWPEITEAARLMSLSEQQHIQAIERYHSVNLGWQGAGYNFLITKDGSIFEGRGWGRSGAHTETRNLTAAGICFTGHGDLEPATGAQWAAARWLIAEGIRLGHLVPNPKISGHRNYSTKGKTCPGTLVYPHIQQLAGITGNDRTDTPIKGLTMSEATAILKELDILKRQKAGKAIALRATSGDKKVWVLTPDGTRYHLPNPGNKPVDVLTFLGVLHSGGNRNVHPIAKEHLNLIPIRPA